MVANINRAGLLFLVRKILSAEEKNILYIKLKFLDYSCENNI